MKSSSFLVLIFVIPIALTVATAQQRDFGVSFNVGGFKFVGASVENSTTLNVNDANSGYTNNPFGGRYGMSYSASIHLRRITKKEFVFGIESGLLHQQCRSKVDQVWIAYDSRAPKAKGRANLKMNGITLLPQIGSLPELTTDLV